MRELQKYDMVQAGIMNEQVGFGRSRKWRISFSSLNKVVDLSARALTVVVDSESDEDVEA